MTYSKDELEFAISKYIDGTLNPLEGAALEEVLATNESVRTMLAEYRRLNEALKTRLTQPRVDFDQLSSQISGALAQAEAPVKHYVLSFGRYARIVALAASIAIAIGVVAKLMMNHGTTPSNDTIEVAKNTSSQSLPEAQGPSIAVVTGLGTMEVSVGAPPGFASAGFADQAVITSTPQLVIESSAPPAQDTTPY